MTSQITITVDYLNPREGNKPASIKAGNTYYGVTDQDYPKFEKGKKYDVTVETREGTGKWSGRTFHDIIGFVPIGSAVRTNGHTQPAQPEGIVSSNPAASVFGIVNSYIAIGAVANDIEAIAGLIDKCEQGFLKSQIGKRSIGV